MSASRRPTRTSLHPHQRKAIAAAVRGFVDHDRGQLLMACGTGKTITAVHLAEAVTAEEVLVLLPNLSLLAQTLREWRLHAAAPFEAIAVCSDETVAESAGMHVADLTIPVTTDPDTLAAWLRRPTRRRWRIVFSTYQSAGVVAAAQRSATPAFDLAVADEAHRTAGQAADSFQLILDGAQIRATKRIFMTATPRLTTAPDAVSMDDEALYGPLFYSYSFREAIRDGFLCDYQVIVAGVTDDSVRPYLEAGAEVMVDGTLHSGAETAAMVAALKAMDQHQLNRMVTFHSRVEAAARFADTLPRIAHWMDENRYAAGLTTGHVHGQQSTAERAAELSALRAVKPGERRVLTNARCLTEGVDVPAIDAVAFINPKSSAVDIVQAVGRALRNAPGKSLGTVLLIVYLGEGEDADEVLASSAFADIWTVLQALHEQDPDFDAALAAARMVDSQAHIQADAEWDRLPTEAQHADVVPPSGHIPWRSDDVEGPDGELSSSGGGHGPQVIFDLPAAFAAPIHKALYARLLAPSRSSFHQRCQELADFVDEHSRFPTAKSDQELDRFAQRQRGRHRRGALTDEQTASLERIPGWSWSPRTTPSEARATATRLHRDGMSYTAIAAQLTADGIVNAHGQARWASATVRKLILSSEDRAVSAVGQGQRWERRYADALQWTRIHGALQRRNPGMTPELAGWLTKQRSAYRAGMLTADRISRLEQLFGWTWDQAAAQEDVRQRAQQLHRDGYSYTSIADALVAEGIANAEGQVRWASSSVRKLILDKEERTIGAISRADRWERRYKQLLERTYNHGRRQPGHRGLPAELAGWVTKQRAAYRSGKLTPERICLLEQLPGWTWE